jgi:cytochrome-b5 reductase
MLHRGPGYKNANVTEGDILLREEFDALKNKYPDTFDVVYVLNKPDNKWQGGTGILWEIICRF